MTEFQQYRDEAVRLRDSLRSKLVLLSSATPNKRAPLSAEIESLFRDVQVQLDLITNYKIMWDSAEIGAATKFVQETVAETRRLADQFAAEKGRSDLLEGARSLAGGGDSDRAGLLQGRRTIAQQAENLRAVHEGVEGIRTAGEGILEDLDRQKEAEGRIDDTLGTLGLEIDTGNRKVRRLEWGERKKTIAVWAVVIIALVGLAVFLYFVFK
jgi:hypothetical protein